MAIKDQSGDETEIWIKRSAASLYRGCFPRDMKTCRNLSGKKIQAPLPKRFDMIKNDLFGRA